MNARAAKFTIPSTLSSGSVLDELTGGQQPAAPPPDPRPRAAPAPTAPPPRPQRVPIRVQVPQDLADRVRGAIATLQYRVPEWASLNVATAAALEQLVTQAEREHNDGEPFPWQSGHKLQPGRRVGR